MDELIAINVVIADRSYRLKTRQQDEGTIRNTAKLINEKIVEFKSAFAGKDLQDYLSMVLLWFTTEQVQLSNNVIADHEAGKTLGSIHSLLDNALSAQ